MNEGKNLLRQPLPWQLPLWQRFCSQHQQQRLPHALLLYLARETGGVTIVLALGEESSSQTHADSKAHKDSG